MLSADHNMPMDLRRMQHAEVSRTSGDLLPSLPIVSYRDIGKFLFPFFTNKSQTHVIDKYIAIFFFRAIRMRSETITQPSCCAGKARRG